MRISTALGTYVVEIINDLGPAADPLTGDLEQCVIACLRAHVKIGPEMRDVDVQRGDLELETLRL